MRILPHHHFANNQTWLERSLIAQDLLCWTRAICLTGELACAEPNRLRHCLLHIAGNSSATDVAPSSNSTAIGPGRMLSPPHSDGCARPRSSAERDRRSSSGP
jgi:hypothetical protein